VVSELSAGTSCLSSKPKLSGSAGETRDLRSLITSAVASSTVPDFSHGGRAYSFGGHNAVDGLWDTCWQTPGAGLGEHLTLEFSRPVDLSRIDLRNGFQWRDNPDFGDLFYANGRVTGLRIEAFGPSGELLEVVDRRVRDTPEGQALPLEVQAVSTLRLTVTSAAGGARWEDLSISEIGPVGVPSPWLQVHCGTRDGYLLEAHL